MLISRSSRPRQKMTIHRVETTNQIMPGRRNSKSPPCRTNRDKGGAPRKLVRPRERLGQPRKNAVVVGVKIQIQDCDTGKIYEYDSHEYHSRPGDDCVVKRPAAPSPPAGDKPGTDKPG